METDIVKEFEDGVKTLERLFVKYFGCAMSDEVYDRFATLRDDTLPALRKQLRAALAAATPAAPAPASEAVAVVEPVSDDGTTGEAMLLKPLPVGTLLYAITSTGDSADAPVQEAGEQTPHDIMWTAYEKDLLRARLTVHSSHFNASAPVWFERGYHAALASREEPPAAAGEALAVDAEWLKERTDELVRRIHARIGTWGEQRKSIVDFAREFAALAATPAPEPVISTEDSLRTRLRWSQERVEQLEEENRTLRGRLPGPNLDDLL